MERTDLPPHVTVFHMFWPRPVGGGWTSAVWKSSELLCEPAVSALAPLNANPLRLRAPASPFRTRLRSSFWELLHTKKTRHFHTWKSESLTNVGIFLQALAITRLLHGYYKTDNIISQHISFTAAAGLIGLLWCYSWLPSCRRAQRGRQQISSDRKRLCGNLFIWQLRNNSYGAALTGCLWLVWKRRVCSLGVFPTFRKAHWPAANGLK